MTRTTAASIYLVSVSLSLSLSVLWAATKEKETRAAQRTERERDKETETNQDIAFNIPVDLYDECFYVTGILSFWILLPSCVLIVLSISILTAGGVFSFVCAGRENRDRENDEDTRWKKGRGRLTVYSRIKVSC